MNCSAEFIDYTQTGYFSKIVTDYIAANKQLQPFYQYPVNVEGIQSSIEARKSLSTDRKLLVEILTEQYSNISLTGKQQEYLQQLGNANTFTICTAHQPNIFTGHLYFIYKILHTIKLAETLKLQFPANNFVPVFYMGSEDADLDELGHVFIKGEKYEWKTSQTGAVGRMKVDKALVKLLDQIEGQVAVYPHGNEIIGLMKACYKEGVVIEKATFELVNALFAEYGLLILMPDSTKVKTAFIPIIEKELRSAFSFKAVQETVSKFPQEYKVQASGRELNLFYLKDDSRSRIEQVDSIFTVKELKLEFSLSEIIEELHEHPERFSPNVILRPVLQELILPNIAFIGGGGEIAYWLELKKVFESVAVPFPMLIVRNSFLLVDNAAKETISHLSFCVHDFFKPSMTLMNELVKRDSALQLDLENEKQQLKSLYKQMQLIAGKVDITLRDHAEALHTQALTRIEALEKKMLRAERKKFEAQQRQVNKIKNQLFPFDSLQERIENVIPFYAKRGADFIKIIYEHSLSLEQQFTILLEK